MHAQIFNPLEQSENENLLKNSGFWNGKDNWIDSNWSETSGVIDDTVTLNGIKSFKSVGNIISMRQELNATERCNSITFSFYIKASSYASFAINVAIETVSETQGSSVDQVFTQIANPTTLNQFVKVSATIDLHEKWIATEPSSWDGNIYIYIVNNSTTWICQPKLEYGSTATPYRPALTDRVPWDYETTNSSFQSAKIGDILNITEYQYKKSLTDVGLFSMTIPLDTPFAEEIAEDYYLFVDKKDWLLVQDVKKTETGYAISGTDLKGILATRITLYDVVNDTMGFDSVNGSTEECCKHYIANNVVNPIDSNRIIPLVTLAENQNRGIANDTYMSRFEYLHEVIKKLCENAKIGYTMYADVMNNKIIVDIVDIVDKTVDQQIRNRVVFDVKNKNVLSYERAKGNSTYKNAFYATKSGGGLESDATTKLCLRDSTAPKGIARKEIHLNVSCESVADIETYAKYQYKDYAKIDSLTIAPADVKGYGVIFDVGDMVTQKIDNEYVNVVIQSAEITYSGGSKNVTINFGDEQPQPLKYLKTMINNKGV